METMKKKKVNLAALLMVASIFMLCPGIGMTAEIFHLNRQQPDLSNVDRTGAGLPKQYPRRVDIVWAEFSDSHNEIFYQRFNGDDWDSKIQLTHDQNDNVAPSISVDDTGIAWIVWSVYQGSKAQLYYLTCDEKMSCSEPQIIPSYFSSNTGASVVIDNLGNPWLVWSASSRNEADEIIYSHWNGSEWSPPERISSKDNFPDVLPIIGLDRQGLPWVYWSGFDGRQYRKYFSSWDGSRWSLKKLVGDQKEIQRQGMSELALLPPLPAFVNDPHKISVYIDGAGSIQSLPVKLLKKWPSN